MDIKQAFTRASTLIKQGHYKEARDILILIDHPKATEWLDKLHTLEQSERAASKRYIATKQRSVQTRVALAIVVWLLVMAFCGCLYFAIEDSSNEARSTIDAIETQYAR